MSTDRVGLKILLVDDDDDDRFLFRTAFGKTGISGDIIEKEDGTEAIQFFDALLAGAGAEWPDLVFLDLKMPGPNGFEVLEWIKTKTPLHPLRIYILSGSNEPADIARGQALGAVDYIIKPLKFEHLRELLSEAERTS
jgi:two-component system, chemotaxis family, response regulator Rcp1